MEIELDRERQRHSDRDGDGRKSLCVALYFGHRELQE